MTTIITVLDNATETSMPFNEFVIYRAAHYPDERHVLILCDREKELPQVDIPSCLKILYVGRDLREIRKCLCAVLQDEKRVSTKLIIHLHQVQSGFLTQLAMLGTGIRKNVLFTVHSSFHGYKLHNKLLSLFNTALAKRITCVGYSSFQDYPKWIKHIKGSRIQPVQNGVDLERIDRIKAERVKGRSTIDFIYVARLVPIKNHSFLVDVLRRCDADVRFIFVGAEDAKKSIRKKAETEGVAERICFTGLIPRNDVYRLLKQADYYISSSTLEGLPISVMEAMYCGLPCILSDIPQHREVAGNIAALLPFEAERWAAEINSAARLPERERACASAAFRVHAAKNFSLAAMHERYDAVYALM